VKKTQPQRQRIKLVLLLVAIVVNGIARVLIRRSIADRPAGAVV